MELHVKLTGSKEAIENMRKVVGETQKEIRDAVLKTAFDIEKDAKELVPVDTGRLRASITVNWPDSNFARAPLQGPVKESRPEDGIERPEAVPETFNAIIGTNVEYARKVEFGIGRRPKAFLYPALASNQDKLNQRLAKVWAK